MDRTVIARGSAVVIGWVLMLNPSVTHAQDLGAGLVRNVEASSTVEDPEVDDGLTSATTIDSTEELATIDGEPVPVALADHGTEYQERPRPAPGGAERRAPLSIQGPPLVHAIEHSEVGEIYRYVDSGWRFVGNGILTGNAHTLITCAHVMSFHTGEIPNGRYHVVFNIVGRPAETFNLVRVHSFTQARRSAPGMPTDVLSDVAVAQLEFDVPPSLSAPAEITMQAPAPGALVTRVSYGPTTSFQGDGAHAPRHFFDETWKRGQTHLLVRGDSGSGVFLEHAAAGGPLYAIASALIAHSRRNVVVPLQPFLVRIGEVTALWSPLRDLSEFDSAEEASTPAH